MWFKLAVIAVMAGQLSLTACAGKQNATEPTKGASQAGQAGQVMPQGPAYQRWEYKVKQLWDGNEWHQLPVAGLNAAGDEGWELACAVPGMHSFNVTLIFKRPKP
jgi:hypothetical protein